MAFRHPSTPPPVLLGFGHALPDRGAQPQPAGIPTVSLRLLGLLLAALTVASSVLGWLYLPRIWPDGVVAHSPMLEPVIRAEARRRDGGQPLIRRDWVGYVAIDERLRADREAGARALVAALRDADPGVRRVAAGELYRLGLDPATQGALIDRAAVHLADPDSRVRADLIRLLVVGGRHDGLVLAAFADRAPAVRRAAIDGLACRRDSRLLGAFLQRLSDPDDDVACSAMSALGSLKLSDAIEPLLAALEGNRRGAVTAAGYALRELPLSPVQRRRMLLALVRALRDDGVRWSALNADWQLDQEHADDVVQILHAALDDPDYQCRQFVAEQLRMRQAPADERLAAVTIEGLQDDDYPYDRSGSYMTYLYNAKWGTRWLWLHPEVGTAGLRTALTSTDAQQRFLAAWLLAMREDTETAEAVCRELIPRLREPAGKTAALWAIQALFRLGAPARPWVEAALPGEDGRQAACLWLLLRDWDDPPRDRYEAARRWHLPLSHLYHDPAWEPALAAPGTLPEPFPELR